MHSEHPPRTLRTALVGLGSVNRNLLGILEQKRQRLAAEFGLEFRIVCIADSSGVGWLEAGYDTGTLLREKSAGTPVSAMAGYAPALSVIDVIREDGIDLVMEASPVNLAHGEPGLGITRAALERGVDVVLANKGPLVLDFHPLHELAGSTGAGLAYSATVCGGLPIVNIGRRDMVAADVHLLRGIFNSTCNFILDEMAAGRDYHEALAEAQQRGIAETDPTLDVEGWDTANKLSIIANSILGLTVGLSDIQVQGITAITAQDLARERQQGRTIKLVAQYRDGRLSVEPTALPRDDFLARCEGWEMGVEIHSDIYGRMYHKLWEREPVPTAASMLRDAVNLCRDRMPVHRHRPTTR